MNDDEWKGWPRPRGVCSADTVDMLCSAVRPGRPSARPVPWVAETSVSGWDPWAFNPARADAMVADDLCQVCGSPRGGTVFALASLLSGAEHRLRDVEHAGGALCSLRCARLTAAVCPRYVAHWPVGVFAVAKRDRVGITDPPHRTDDKYDVSELDPVAVIGGP